MIKRIKSGLDYDFDVRLLSRVVVHYTDFVTTELTRAYYDLAHLYLRQSGWLDTPYLVDQDDGTITWVNPLPYLKLPDVSVKAESDKLFLQVRDIVDERTDLPLRTIITIFEYGNYAYGIPGARILSKLIQRLKTKTLDNDTQNS